MLDAAALPLNRARLETAPEAGPDAGFVTLPTGTQHEQGVNFLESHRLIPCKALTRRSAMAADSPNITGSSAFAVWGQGDMPLRHTTLMLHYLTICCSYILAYITI